MTVLPNRRATVRVMACLALAALCWTLRAQERESALSNAEIETLRDTAYYPPERLTAFIGFLDQRTKAIDKLATGRRQPGREEDIHDLMEQFTSIADDLDDNLEEYGTHHKDIRKALPKVVAACERWATALKTPAEDDAYKVSRKLALETLADIHAAAVKLIDDQKAWFRAHPPPKDDGVKQVPKT